jgi:hypothetical protein
MCSSKTVQHPPLLVEQNSHVRTFINPYAYNTQMQELKTVADSEIRHPAHLPAIGNTLISNTSDKKHSVEKKVRSLISALSHSVKKMSFLFSKKLLEPQTAVQKRYDSFRQQKKHHHAGVHTVKIGNTLKVIKR